MEIVLLGTGAAAGWPNPFCRCASCAHGRRSGVIRGQNAALVDDVLLLDCGPEVPRAAERLGRPLTDVRHVLLTHAHADHTAPPVLPWRDWAGRTDSFEIVGPPRCIELCREWTHNPGVSFREVRAGDEITVGSYAVRVLAANHAPEQGPPVLYDITGPDGARLFFGTDTATLPSATVDAMSGTAYDVVLLEETFGDDDGTPHGHLDLTTFPAVVAALRANGAITDTTRVVAVHLGCGNPPAPELARRLAPWGVELLSDGAVIDLAQDAPARPTPARHPARVLVTGGARSGKSREAERRLLGEPAVTYVATARRRPDDGEWAARVTAHVQRRPTHWRTIETTDLVKVLDDVTEPTLIDCLTLWLGAVLDDGVDVDGAITDVVDAWRRSAGPVVAVTNEVGSGVVPPTSAGRVFRDALGELNARIAAESDEVWAMTAGVAQRVK